MEQVSSLTRLVRDGGIESTLPLQTIKPVKAERLKITKIRRKIMQIKIQDDAWKRKIRNRVNTNTISEDISGDYLTIKKHVEVVE